MTDSEHRAPSGSSELAKGGADQREPCLSDLGRLSTPHRADDDQDEQRRHCEGDDDEDDTRPCNASCACTLRVIHLVQAACSTSALSSTDRELCACQRIARRAGITKRVGPHTLRHAFITAALDAGVPLREVQEAASHADPRTTMRYDRARVSLDRHATHIVAAFVAGAAR